MAAAVAQLWRLLRAAALVLLSLAVLRAQHVYPDRLEVKLREGCGAVLVDGRLVSRTGVELAAVARCFATAAAEPLVRAVPRATLDRWHRRACAVLPEGRRPGHLGLWFRLRASSAAAADRLLQALASEPLVEHVYREPRLVPAGALPNGDLPPTTPSFVAQQLSHAPTPVGHSVRQVGSVLGARGRGVGLFMIEHSWVFGHEDCCKVAATNVLGAVPAVTTVEGNHGLSGASIVMADRNAYGVTGVADEVDARFVALGPNGGYANSVALAMLHAQPGDVVMCVVMILVPTLGPGSWLPLEFLQSSFDATLTATANGLHVVLPAGNGARNLDDPALLGRFDRSVRDSGSVIVGASAGGALQRASYSNWGSRVDAHSWGEQVVSCGYGSLFFPNQDPLQAYTAAGTGTSSATPHIAAVIAALQGASERQLGQRLDNSQILGLLHTLGPATSEPIGRRTDLWAAMAQLGILDGLVLSEPDVAPGAVVTAVMDGPNGALAGLFGSFATADLPLGFNRNVHLDPLSMAPFGAFVLTSGTAQFQLAVPNHAALHGVDLYLQAVRIAAGQPLHVSNSCQLTIL